MKKIILISSFLLCSCFQNYQYECQVKFYSLKMPIRIIGKNCSEVLGDSLCSVLLVDAAGTRVWFGNQSGIATTIGLSYNVGDTIK